MPGSGWKRWVLIGGGAFLILLLAAAAIWRDDILRTSLDPKLPFQTYDPPAAPNYDAPAAWALRPSRQTVRTDGRPVDVFFVHPTTYNGGRHWNGPIDDPKASRQLAAVMLPNYAGPFFRVGRVYAPRYRQASLYSYLTRREDAAEARRFAYGDVERAFRRYLAEDNDGRPFIVVGVEQGGFLADRLLREVVAADPAILKRLAAAYLLRTVVPASDFPATGPIPPCSRREEAGCVVAYAAAPATGAEQAREFLGRALVWDHGEELVTLDEPALCVNPLLGRQTDEPADRRLSLGAANATDLEWGVRPPLLPRQSGAQCVEGVLRSERPRSPSLKATGGWADRLKAPPYNLFFADLEADAIARVAAWRAAP